MERYRTFATPIAYRASWLYGRNSGIVNDSRQDGRSDNPFPLLSVNSPYVDNTEKAEQPTDRRVSDTNEGTKELSDKTNVQHEFFKLSDKTTEEHDESVKHVLEDFGRETTAHGIVHITNATSSVTRSTWIIIVLVAACAMLVQMTLLLIQYFEYNVHVKVTLVSEKALGFPSVTICNTNKLRHSAIRSSKYSEMLMLERNFVPPYYTPCIEGDFTCRNGIHCIRPFLVCDGVNQCGDMSDEYDCIYPDCGPNQFRCDSGSEFGVCIPNDYFCDRISHCYGGEDETSCGECSEDEFQCITSRECVASLKTCDQLFDCRDGSDESASMCVPVLRNVALGKPTEHSVPSQVNGTSENAVDGDNATCAHTEKQYAPMWSVDLGKTYLVYEIRITHRKTWNPRLFKSEVLVGSDAMSSDNQVCYTKVQKHQTQAESFTLKCTPNAVAGRYVSIQVKGKEEDMRLCEVQVMAVDSKYWSLAFKQKASQSSTFAYGSAMKAVDGDKSNNYNERTCTHTQKEYQPWWKVDLGGEYEIDKVIITNRADCCDDRLSGAVVRVGNDDVIENNERCGQTVTKGDINQDGEVTVECVLQGRFVSVQLENKTDYLSLCEVQVFGEDIVDNLPNVAINKPAEQSSTYYNFDAYKAVDGNEDPAMLTGLSCICSAKERGAWWRVDLIDIYAVYKVVITNRYDCCSSRIVGAVIRIGYYRDGIGRNAQCGGQIADRDMQDKTIVRDCIIPILGQYVIVQNGQDKVTYLHFCEIKVFASEYVTNQIADIMEMRMFSMFEARDGLILDVNSTDVFSELLLHKCMYKCMEWKRYECHSFDFHHGSKTCRLHNLKEGIDGVQVVKSAGNIYYQRLRLTAFISSDNETECPDDYIRCTSGECVHPYKICDVIVDCADGFDEMECVNSESNGGRLFNFSPGWYSPYLTITDDLAVYTHFEENVYVHHNFDRVKGEDPPDWIRFRMFSESPDFSELTRVLQLSVDEISELGHQAEDFILQCTYAGEKCDPKNDFIVSQDQYYGNCFHFNGDPETTRLSTGTGPEQGLTMTLFMEQDEYLSIYGQDSAAVVGITPPGSQYFPQDQGFFALPGTVTSVSLSMSKLNRQSYPFGNCSNQVNNKGIDERVAAMYGSGQYTLEGCGKACLQNALVVYCGCTDTLGIDAPPCRMLNETQVVCKQLIYYMYQKDLLQCDCPPPCSETTYDMTISQSQWPSHAYLNNLLKAVQASNKKTQNMHDLESARANLVRLKIYFETLNHELTSELPAYTWEDLLSDVGGTLGLYVGFSVITVCEFVRLIFNLCGKVSFKRIRND
ncbi:uncharacterized protein [Ptychodera flava]|uniref:uncharacterized protein n=1 Tax=Ptychodera flava TaxID=63121 RepID=UPI00396AA5F5